MLTLNLESLRRPSKLEAPKNRQALGSVRQHYHKADLQSTFSHMEGTLHSAGESRGHQSGHQVMYV